MTKKSEEVKPVEEAKATNEQAADVIEDTNNEETNQEEAPSPVEALQAEVEDLKNQNLRLYAEFENFRKRNARERVELATTANKDVLAALLPILDDFNRALKNTPEAEADSETAKGMSLIYNKFNEALKSKGLKPMENTIGKKFDVDFMEAITKIPAPEAGMEGKVVDEIEAGYMIGDKILRYAKVVVADGEPQS